METTPLKIEAKVLETYPIEKIERQGKPTFIKQRVLYNTQFGKIIVDAIGSKVRQLENIENEDLVILTFYFNARNWHNNHTLKSIEKL